ncbi:MAG: reductive dehalogenase [Anaerolineae bacterium]|nr:reductive dehalogenase [Anaerolineae bacterium]
MTDNKHAYQDTMVDGQVFQRFPRRLTTFGRWATDASASFYRQTQAGSALAKAEQEIPGYSQVEAAMSTAAWTVAHHFSGAYSSERLGNPHFLLEGLGQYPVKNPAAMSHHIKTAARLFGAGLTGICEYDIRWVYQFDHEDHKMQLPEGLKYVVVMAIPMDAHMILTAPKLMAAVATGAGYSKMAAVAASVAQFVRHLGYQAVAMGNDTALSIPIAIDAGLGQMGRNGMLITNDYGPCVRLCKVFTDMPLMVDPPIEQGLVSFCESCRRCAEACPAGAISCDEIPSFQVVCQSNNPGIRRWAVNADRCFHFWMENGSSCSSCIAACPYTKRALKRQTAIS